MIDVVMPKSLADHLLKQIGFFVGAFGRTKTRNTSSADIPQPIGGKIQRLVPLRLTEEFLPVGGVHIQPLGRCIITADQGFGQAVIMVDVVKPKPAFHAQPTLVRRAINSFDVFYFAVFDFQRNLAANTTERANALDLFIKIRAVADLVLIHHA